MSQDSEKESPFTAAAVRNLLASLGLRARKSLGQHFLVDRKVLREIMAAAELSTQDTAVEIGAGLGVLTRELAQRAGRVIAVEMDDKLSSFLGQALSPFPNVQIIAADILKITPASLLCSSSLSQQNGRAMSGDDPRLYKVVANLPYYIASPVLRHFLEASLKPTLMVVTVQKEVGETIVAPPGKMSLLAISVQLYAHPCIVARVPARSFYPSPKVDSVVLRLELYPRTAVTVPDVARFFAVVRAGFSAPRKQLGNSLARGLGLSSGETIPLLHQAGIDPRRRAETLSLEEWAKVCQVSYPSR